MLTVPGLILLESRQRPYPGTSCDDSIPGAFDIMSEIRDRSKSCDDDSSQLNGLVGSQRGSNRY